MVVLFDRKFWCTGPQHLKNKVSITLKVVCGCRTFFFFENAADFHVNLSSFNSGSKWLTQLSSPVTILVSIWLSLNFSQPLSADCSTIYHLFPCQKVWNPLQRYTVHFQLTLKTMQCMVLFGIFTCFFNFQSDRYQSSHIITFVLMLKCMHEVNGHRECGMNSAETLCANVQFGDCNSSCHHPRLLFPLVMGSCNTIKYWYFRYSYR